jgi:hypothetical protein
MAKVQDDRDQLIPIEHPLAPELEAPQDLGTEELEVGRFFARVGDQPMPLPISAVFAAANQPLPREYAQFDAYESWIVPHRIGVIRKGGVVEVTGVGIEVRYDAGGSTCSIQSLLPASKFVTRGGLFMNVDNNGAGEAAPLDWLDDASKLGSVIRELGTLRVHVRAAGGVKLALRAEVVTPDIQAIGKGASVCAWQFDRDRLPLYGRDIETWSVLTLPRRRRELEYAIRFSLNLRALFYTTRRESEWTHLRCRLEGGRQG